SKLVYEGFLKPLQMFYDGEDPSVRTYLLTNYSYYPLMDTYDAEWWEYNNSDTINITYS
ncbi:unnamed protein product, partial [marine sediment metagenome]